ncbi:DnaB-like helicase C-terminal domain-containing protein [Faecalitalea cylindroides]|uniref:DnaB-like helicase C-terminal domain-containing protein n=1 Tax=Faecalitalea cylindroides TaxID=39483 RepID=UPI0022DF11B7|nr:DnaB-like helicase C-terminal domain-containing protein [Faecalitalea cylindroides]
MRVFVKIGNEIIHSADTNGEIATERARDLMKYAQKGESSDIFRLLLSKNAKMIEEIKNNLNPNYIFEDRLLNWQLDSLVDLNVRPNISLNFSKNFFETGYMPGELYVLSGISGGGKTSLSVQIATTLATGFNFFSDEKKGSNADVIYVTLEQNKKQIQARVMSNLMATLYGKKSLSFSQIISGDQCFSSDFKEALLALSMIENRLSILDFAYFGGSPTIDELKSVVSLELQKMKSTEKKLLIVDRYENIQGASSNVDDSVARELKNFAVQNNVPILLQCQLSKNAIESAKTSDGKFNLDKISASSLKGTSGLEHQCSNVMIIVPDLRQSDKDQKVVSIIQPKNRYGLNQAIKLNFQGSCGLFTEFVETRGRKKKEDEAKGNDFDRKEAD